MCDSHAGLCTSRTLCAIRVSVQFLLSSQVDAEKQRFSVTLKPGLVAGQDASLLRSLFADLEFVAQLRHVADRASRACHVVSADHEQMTCTQTA